MLKKYERIESKYLFILLIVLVISAMTVAIIYPPADESNVSEIEFRTSKKKTDIELVCRNGVLIKKETTVVTTEEGKSEVWIYESIVMNTHKGYQVTCEGS